MHGKIVRAVADGVVLTGDLAPFDEQEPNGADAAHPTGRVADWSSGKDGNPEWGNAPHTSPGGNHVWVRHGERKVLYAHLLKGSITGEAGIKAGATVYRGQMLGRVGFTGNINREVHLHIHAEDVGGALSPLPIPWSATRAYPAKWATPGPLTDKWSRLNNEGLPAPDDSIIVPSATYPGFPIRTLGFVENGVAGSDNNITTSNIIWSTSLAAFLDGARQLSRDGRGKVVLCSTYKECADQPSHYGTVVRAGVKWQTDFVHELGLLEFAEAVAQWSRKGFVLVWMNTYVDNGGHRAIFGVVRMLPASGAGGGSAAPRAPRAPRSCSSTVRSSALTRTSTKPSTSARCTLSAC
jgi:hypothetical protein